ncbi:MAG: hypothetical protein Q7R65_03695 [bacterium]|nr:hypothetical protein [bacterium]
MEKTVLDKKIKITWWELILSGVGLNLLHVPFAIGTFLSIAGLLLGLWEAGRFLLKYFENHKKQL